MFLHGSLCLELHLDASSSLSPWIGHSRTSKTVKTSSEFCTSVHFLAVQRYIGRIATGCPGPISISAQPTRVIGSIVKPVHIQPNTAPLMDSRNVCREELSKIPRPGKKNDFTGITFIGTYLQSCYMLTQLRISWRRVFADTRCLRLRQLCCAGT
jgi:hypothetical protein